MNSDIHHPENPNGGRPRQWTIVRIAAWSLAAALLLAPAIAMRFTDEVDWTASDFVIAGILIGGTGGLFELAVRFFPNAAYRGGVGVALAAAFLLTWINGAVGIIGSETNPANDLFALVPLVAFAGAMVGGFKARGMARAMVAAAAAQLAIGVAALFMGFFILPITAFFMMFWLFSAWLFRRAAS